MGGVFILLFIEIYFDWIPPSPRLKIGANNGCSVFSFSILYLLARFIRLYGLPDLFIKYSPFIYLVCSVLAGLMIHVTIITGHENIIALPMSYINPVLILSSVAFLMMFVRLKFYSISINYIAKSTLACLLGHSSIFFLYTKQFKYLYDHFTGIEVLIYWTIAVVTVFVASILIDQIRLLMWKPLYNLLRVHIINDHIF